MSHTSIFWHNLIFNNLVSCQSMYYYTFQILNICCLNQAQNKQKFRLPKIRNKTILKQKKYPCTITKKRRSLSAQGMFAFCFTMKTINNNCWCFPFVYLVANKFLFRSKWIITQLGTKIPKQKKPIIIIRLCIPLLLEFNA